MKKLITGFLIGCFVSPLIIIGYIGKKTDIWL